MAESSPEALSDRDRASLKLLQSDKYQALPDEQALKIVNLSFKILVNGEFPIGINQLGESFQEQIRESAKQIYQQLGLDVVMGSQFILFN
mmetsp:Transcript_9716/g.16362  ORF Transcript_9716/g.16362 Transcript_9716/m.16362 type:complete len:90 (+) Transcript_9716:1702-1971(+)